jgi:hypothetical protein
MIRDEEKNDAIHGQDKEVLKSTNGNPRKSWSGSNNMHKSRPVF